jgi:hypothetical protein
LFKTREYYSLGAIHDSDSTHGLSLFEFLDQFNPLELNANQARDIRYLRHSELTMF